MARRAPVDGLSLEALGLDAHETGTTDDFFRLAVDYDGTTALISTLHPNGNQGAAYFYMHDTIFTDGFDG